MVDEEEAEGYLVSCCVKDPSGNYQIMSGARASKQFSSPYQLYVGLLGKLFHTKEGDGPLGRSRNARPR